MTWVAVGVAGASLVGSAMQANAAGKAANAQQAAAQAGIGEEQRQFDTVHSLLSPFVTAGAGGFNGQAYLAANPDVAADPYWSLHPDQHYAQHGMQEGRANPGNVKGSLSSQQDLLGLNGPEAQQAAYTQIQQSPAFTSQLKLGENRILANASATGGLRGGNVQAAIGMFSPQLLAQTISDQYNRLGGITSLGQNAAAGVGNAGMATGQGIAGLLQQGGAAAAGGALGQGRAQVGAVNGFGTAFGTYMGAGGTLGGGGRSSAPTPDAVNLGTATGNDLAVAF